jgi:hypothetical protein
VKSLAAEKAAAGFWGLALQLHVFVATHGADPRLCVLAHIPGHPVRAILRGMSDSCRAPRPPLEDAILAWDAAVAAVVQETYRIASGVTADPDHLDELRAAVEAARQRCETLATSVLAGDKKNPR